MVPGCSLLGVSRESSWNIANPFCKLDFNVARHSVAGPFGLGGGAPRVGGEATLKWLEAPSVRRGSLNGCPCVLIDQNAGRSCFFCDIILSRPGCPQNPDMVTCRFSATLAKAAALSAVLSPRGKGPPLRPSRTMHDNSCV
jgi:hypothetical protein